MPEPVNTSPSGPNVIYKGQVSINYGTVAASITEDGTAAFAPADANDGVVVAPTAALTAGLFVAMARCNTTGQIQIALGNVTAGTLTPNTVTFDVFLIKGSAAL